jgi:D-ribose pyranose/furanose isomerase RbsD
MKEYNRETYDELQKIFVKQDKKEVSMEEFIELSANAKLFIRTGELKPASNILLTSASGAGPKRDPYDVSFSEEELKL